MMIEKIRSKDGQHSPSYTPLNTVKDHSPWKKQTRMTASKMHFINSLRSHDVCRGRLEISQRCFFSWQLSSILIPASVTPVRRVFLSATVSVAMAYVQLYVVISLGRCCHFAALQIACGPANVFGRVQSCGFSWPGVYAGSSPKISCAVEEGVSGEWAECATNKKKEGVDLCGIRIGVISSQGRTLSI